MSMLTYNLAAEYLSLVLISIMLFSLLWDNESNTTRYSVFKLLFFGAFFQILITISTTLLSEQFMDYPLLLNTLVKTIYFLILPVVPVISYFYVVSMSFTRSVTQNFAKKIYLGLVPYFVYAVIIIANLFNQSVFYFSPEVGYVRGDLYQISFVVVLIYMVYIIAICLINFKNLKREVDIILIINTLVASLLMSGQLFFSDIIFSGASATSQVLLIYLYVQNTSKSTDILTGLFNRQSLTHRMRRLASMNIDFAFYLCSIRNFKTINETYSLEYGDSILELMSIRLKSVTNRKNVFRYSGDEFVVLSYGKYNDESIIEKIRYELEKPYEIGKELINIDILYTRVNFPEYSNDIKTLVTTADYSIAQIKEGHINSNYLYNIKVRNEMQRFNFVIDSLKDAIENDGFVLSYQPIYETKTREFTQLEALLRLKNGPQFSLYPNEFIPVAEKAGQIIAITYIVVEKVCQDLNTLKKLVKNNPVKSVSINFPYTMFLDELMPNKLLTILKKYNIDPKEIKIEITERALVSDIKSVNEIIAIMQKQGFEFELDDFGIEYSNMSVFLTLPIDIIKIDRSLVQAMNNSSRNEAFISKMIEAIINSGRSVVIEGVEELDEALNFIGREYHYLQGYHFSRPLPLEDLVKFLDKQTTYSEI